MELFKLLGRIAVDNSDANKSIDETTDKAKESKEDIKSFGDEGEKSGGKVSSAFSKMGSFAAKAGKVIVAGLGVASVAVGKIGKDAISAYGDYEQLVGGVETLFKDSSDTVIQNASRAYKTAGMSANEYMETVTGFSASLLQSLGGDTVAAAKKSDVAITDMADNANKMGTSMEDIQNAYQGFAKQNYTMLDNLKLGYGGTKEEMERLLSDAQKISGVKYDISSYADIVDAIHVVQTEMGITGTTAKEASTTIQGSLSSAKSAWQNLLAGLTDGNQNIDGLITNVFNSVVTVADNIIPRIQQVLQRVPSLVTKLVPKLISKVSEVITTLLPSIVSGAVSLINALVGTLPQFIQAILSAIPSLLNGVYQVFTAIVNALPQLMSTLCNALPTLIPQLIAGITSMVLYLMTHFTEIIQPLIDNLPQIIISIVNSLMDNLPILIQGAIQLVIQLVQALPEIIISLIEALPTILKSIVEGLWESLPVLLTGIVSMVGNIFKSIWKVISNFFGKYFSRIAKYFTTIWENIKKIFEPVIKFFSKIFSGVWNGIKSAFSSVGTWFSNVFSGAWKGIKKVWNGVGNFFSGIWQGIKNVFSGIGKWFSNIFTGAWNGIKSVFSGVSSFFKKIFDGIVSIVKAPINLIIKGINFLIGGVNKISFDVPDWVPIIGGKKFGFNIPKIPKLAKGTVVDKPTPAVFGEDGAEAVVPLENNTGWIRKVAQQLHQFTLDTKNLSVDRAKDLPSEKKEKNTVNTQTTLTSNIDKKLDTLLTMLSKFFPELLDKDSSIILDDDTLVSKIAPKMDKQLDKLAKRKKRGITV